MEKVILAVATKTITDNCGGSTISKGQIVELTSKKADGEGDYEARPYGGANYSYKKASSLRILDSRTKEYKKALELFKQASYSHSVILN